MVKEVYLQSTKNFNGVVEKPLHGYNRAHKGHSDWETSSEQIYKPNVLHGLKDKKIKLMQLVGV